MTFEDILSLEPQNPIIVKDAEFLIESIEQITLSNGEKMVWLFADDGSWLVVDKDAHELISFTEVEESQIDLEEDYVMYLSESYTKEYDDVVDVNSVTGETDHDEGEPLDLVHFESDEDDERVIRHLFNPGTAEEMWYAGHMITEEDIRVAQ